MRGCSPIIALLFLLLIGCDPNRSTRPIQVVAPAELMARQSCQALIDAELKVQDEVVMTGTAEHGRPDVVRVKCDNQEHTLIFMLLPKADDLGMREFRKQWQKKTSPNARNCAACPKYNISARFVGLLRTDPADSKRLLYIVRTADRIHRLKIRRPEQK